MSKLGSRDKFVSRVGKGLKERMDVEKRADLYKKAAQQDPLTSGATQEAIALANKEMKDQIDFLKETASDLWSLNNKRPTKVKASNRRSKCKDPIEHLNATLIRIEEMYDNLNDENPHNNQGLIRARVAHTNVIPGNLLGKINSRMTSDVAKLIWKKFRRGEKDVCKQQLVEVYADYAPLALGPQPGAQSKARIDVGDDKTARRCLMLPRFYGLITTGQQPPQEGDIISGFFGSSSPDSGVFVKILEEGDLSASINARKAFKTKGKTQLQSLGSSR